jgi:Tol biopolymer transport system component
MNADGSQMRQLTHFNVPYEAANPNWSTDGKKISFQYDINGGKQSNPKRLCRAMDHESGRQ